MTLEELIKSLGLDTDENKDKAGILKKEFNAKAKEANDASKKSEKFEKQLEALSKVEEQLKIVKDAFKLDLDAEDFDAMVDEVKESLSTATKIDPVDQNELKDLRREKTRLTRERDNLDKQYKQAVEQLGVEKTNRINQRKAAEIRKALDTNKILKPEQMVDLFSSRVITDDEGEVFTIKGSDGSEFSINDYIADWAKDNPEFVIAETKGGAGSGGFQGLNLGGGSPAGGKPANSNPQDGGIMAMVLANAASQSGSADAATNAKALFG